MKTYSAKPSDIQKQWVLIDAKNLVVGRLAAIIAQRLRGKHKPSFTPHMDMGDHVVVINADKISLTGNKMRDKIYYHHTGYPGGIRSATPEKLLADDKADRIIHLAVKRMLPRGPLGRQQLTHLRVYKGEEHPHMAQNPEVLDVAKLNRKNIKES
ncbi:MAG: 50S ribosomal protein L13 [Parvibaculales bacterium]